MVVVGAIPAKQGCAIGRAPTHWKDLCRAYHFTRTPP